MTHKNDKQIFDQIIGEWCRELPLHFNDSLRGILQFGSTTKSYLKIETDIDLLLVFSELPKNRRDRFKLLDEPEKKLMHKLKLNLPNHNLLLSPLLRVPKDLSTFSVLYLDMVEFSVIHFDPDQLLNAALVRTKNWINKSGAHKIHQGTKWYWVLNPKGTTDTIDW